MHKAWCSVEEVPYNFSRSSIKFQSHTGWKINDLNPIWVRLLGWSQLSNPSDLPCSQFSRHRIITKFSGVITIDKNDAHTKDQRSKVKVKEVKKMAPIWAFSDHNSSLNSHIFMIWIPFGQDTRPVAAIKSLRFAFSICWCGSIHMNGVTWKYW